MIPKRHTAKEGENITLYCNSFGKTRWKFNGKPISKELISDVPVKIYIDYATISHRGIYECEGQTISGLDYLAHAAVYVQGMTDVSQKHSSGCRIQFITLHIFFYIACYFFCFILINDWASLY